MEGLAAAVVLLAVLLGVLLVVAFDLFCLVHLAASERSVRLAKLAWAAVIVCAGPLGGAAYLLFQPRPRLVPYTSPGASARREPLGALIPLEFSHPPERVRVKVVPQVVIVPLRTVPPSLGGSALRSTISYPDGSLIHWSWVRTSPAEE